MPKSLEFYFDYGSPATYLAWTQLPALTARTGAEIVHRPMLLGGVFKATGNHSPVTIPAKGAHMWIDFERSARLWGVPFVRNHAFPINTLNLMRGAIAARRDGTLAEYSRAVYEAIWVQDRNMNDPGTVAEVLRSAGLDADAFRARSADPDIKQALIQATEEAVARGVFGAPTYFVDGLMFWGQDRLGHVELALAGKLPA